jgi:hypothetical protein
MGFHYYHCFDVLTRERFFSPVHRAFVIENILSIVTLVPGMSKENSKMVCVLFNKIHSLHINSNSSYHLSKAVSDFLFHLSSLVLLTFATRINSSKSPALSKIFVIFLSTSAICFVTMSHFLPSRMILKQCPTKHFQWENAYTPFF